MSEAKTTTAGTRPSQGEREEVMVLLGICRANLGCDLVVPKYMADKFRSLGIAEGYIESVKISCE